MAALCALGGLTAAASGQATVTRECSPDDIRQALAGDYAGPPCRFTDMPDGADAAPRRPSPQLAGAPPARRPAAPPVVPESRVVSESRVASTPRVRPAPRAVVPQVRPIRTRAVETSRSQDPSRETVRLDDSFFTGGLTGGVGRAPTIRYVYRGVIVIDGSGRTSILTPGQVTTAPVLRMDRRAALRTYPVGH
ncbi:hypothetical protein [Maricaulis sp.]|uniref:hypothetical protein n=1 Tax=Maricaulis sp. TaxID=1486257 RepID=UPI002B27AC6C|nr:hypothetical protein [Maricaulis sp.]